MTADALPTFRIPRPEHTIAGTDVDARRTTAGRRIARLVAARSDWTRGQQLDRDAEHAAYEATERAAIDLVVRLDTLHRDICGRGLDARQIAAAAELGYEWGAGTLDLQDAFDAVLEV